MNECPGKIPSLLTTLLNGIHREGIVYCLLRDADQLDRLALGGELDLLVTPDHLGAFTRIARQVGFASLPSLGYAPHQFFAGYDAQNGGWLKLDVVTAITYGSPVPQIPTDLGARCLAGRRKVGAVYAPAAADAFIVLLLHCLFDKGRFEPSRREQLSALVEEIGGGEVVRELVERYLPGMGGWPVVAGLVRRGEWDAVLSHRQELQSRLARGSRWARSLKRLTAKAQRWLNRRNRAGRPVMPMVALLAPDGAGKSTLVSAIKESFYYPVFTVYMGNGNTVRKQSASRVPGLRFAQRVTRQWGNYLSAAAQRAKGRLVIFDRYPYDGLLPNSGRKWAERLRLRLLAGLFPPPDMVFILDAPGQVLFDRKGEHSADFLEKQRQGYLALRKQLPNATVIDVTAGPEQVKRQVIHGIWQRIVLRQTKGEGTMGEQNQKAQAKPNQQNKRVGYLIARFPKLTETFILSELIAMEQAGVSIELYPLIRERAKVVHREAEPYIARAQYLNYLSREVVGANLYYLFNKPRAYLGALWAVIRANIGSRRLLVGGLAAFPKAAAFARKMQADGIGHVHAHFATHAATAAFIIHRLTGIPYSFTAHGSDIHCHRHMLREKVAEAKFAVPISKYNKDVILDATKGNFGEKLKVIHCGVDTRGMFQPVVRNEDPTGSMTFTILCIGTLHEVKGQAYLIESCRRLHQEGIAFRCHFIGSGPDRAALVKQAAAAGIDTQVIFHGQMTRQEVLEMIHKADVVAVPSVPTSSGKREGIPTVLMEAMSCGVPVVASALSGIPEIVSDGENGLLVPPRDSERLAAALRRLYEDPELRCSLGAAGRLKVEREFDLFKNAARLAEQFFQEVA